MLLVISLIQFYLERVAFGVFLLGVSAIGLSSFTITHSTWWRTTKGKKLLARGKLDEALKYFEKVAYKEGLLEVGNIALSNSDNWTFDEYKFPLCEIGIKAYSCVSHTIGLIEIANTCVEKAKDQKDLSKQRAFLQTALRAYNKASHMAGLLHLANDCVAMAKVQSERKNMLGFIGIARDAYEAAQNQEGANQCSTIQRAIGRYELAGDQKGYARIEPSEKLYAKGIGNPVVIVHNFEKIPIL